MVKDALHQMAEEQSAPPDPQSAEEALRHPTWQTRRVAWEDVGTGKWAPTGAVLAAAFAAEQNANVLEAALDGVRDWIDRTDELSDAVEAGVVSSIAQRGLGASRPSTVRKAQATLEAALRRDESRQATFKALIDGLGTDVRRGGGKLPAACARLLAADLPTGCELSVQLGKLFSAASSDCRLAAAELVLAIETSDSVEAAALLEKLGPSAQKAVERARASTTARAPRATPPPGPPPKQEEAPEQAQGQNVDVSAVSEKESGSWATADEFFAEMKAAQAEAEQDWVAMSSSAAWLERKSAVESLASFFAAKKIPNDLKEAIAVSPDFEEVIAAVSTKAATEPHAKVAASAIESLATIVSSIGAPCLPAATKATFGNPDASEVPCALQRAKDKRLAHQVSILLRAMSDADTWLAVDDASCIAALSQALSGKKKLPPAGRAAILDWLGDIRGLPPRRRSLCLEPYVKLAASDALDANPDLRRAAASALATLSLLGASLDTTTDDDKRVKAKIDELVDQRRAYFKPPARSNKRAAQGAQKSKQPPLRQSASAAPVTRHQEPPKHTHKDEQPRAAPEVERAKTNAARPRSAPQPPKSEPPQMSIARLRPAASNDRIVRFVALKDVVSPATRSALGEAKDKDSWKRRRDALEKITAACGRLANSVEEALDTGKETRQLVVQLRARLADSQAKLRPLACDAIAALFAAIEPREQAARLGAKLAVKAVLGAVLDSSRGVRAPALAALSTCLGEDVDGAVCGRALAEAAPHFAAALAGNASPAAKPDLLVWFARRAANGLAPKHAPDCDRDMVPALLGLMSDKAKDTRDASHGCLLILAKVGAITKLAVENTLRDIPPAAKRALHPRLQDLVYGPQENVLPRYSTDSLSKTAPANDGPTHNTHCESKTGAPEPVLESCKQPVYDGDTAGASIMKSSPQIQSTSSAANESVDMPVAAIQHKDSHVTKVSVEKTVAAQEPAEANPLRLSVDEVSQSPAHGSIANNSTNVLNGLSTSEDARDLTAPAAKVSLEPAQIDERPHVSPAKALVPALKTAVPQQHHPETIAVAASTSSVAPVSIKAAQAVKQAPPAKVSLPMSEAGVPEPPLPAIEKEDCPVRPPDPVLVEEYQRVEVNGETSAESGESRFSELGVVEEARVQKSTPIDVPAVFHFEDADRNSGFSAARSPVFGESELEGQSPDEIVEEAVSFLEGFTSSGAWDEDEFLVRAKKALKVITYFASRSSHKPNRFTVDDGLASTLARVVDFSIMIMTRAKTDADRSRLGRFTRLALVAAHACVKVAPMRRETIRDVLRVATRRAAERKLEGDLEIRTALNDLAVAAGLDAPRPQALAAVLDLLVEEARQPDRLVSGQLARLVHLATSEDDNSGGRRGAWSVESKNTLAELIAPLIEAAHDLFDKVVDDNSPHQLALDSAKTLLVFILRAFGLDVVLSAAAATNGRVPSRGPLCDFARAIARDQPPSQPPRLVENAAAHLAKRLHNVKAASTTRHAPITTRTDLNTSERIAQLRARLSASQAVHHTSK